MPPAGYPAFLQYLQSGRVRIVVEHDLGESSGSTVDVAPSWVSMA